MCALNWDNAIWDTQPASDWAEAYPLGDGRVGAMVFGRPAKDIISLNHDLLWRDYLGDPVSNMGGDIETIKRLCQSGHYAEAEQVLTRHIPRTGSPIYINPFVPFGDLYLNLFLPEGEVSDYRRSLDLEGGEVRVTFRVGDITYEKTYFCDHASHLFCVRLRASRPAMLTGEIALSRMPDADCERAGRAGYGYVTFRGRFEEGRTFCAVSRILHANGRVTMGRREGQFAQPDRAKKHFGLGYVFDRNEGYDDAEGASALFDHCDEVTILTSLAVDAESDDPETACFERFRAFAGFDDALKENRRIFSVLFNKTALHIASEADLALSSHALIERFRKEDAFSPAIVQRLYQMARYTLIASGMPENPGEIAKAPINLQGLWCRDTWPGWECDYHTDLNIEMCYWSLPALNLSELALPLLNWMENLLPQARRRAKDLYGCDGAAFGACCDTKTISVTDNVGYGWLCAGAWLTQVLFHCASCDPSQTMIKRVYAVATECAEFFRNMLVKGADGRLSFPFGASPEMGIVVDGAAQWLASAATCDLLGAKELFVNLENAAQALGDPDAARRYADLAKAMRDPAIDADGCLREWEQSHIESEPGHRHRSPFYSFCPGNLLSPEKEEDRKLISAMKALLERRLNAGTAGACSFSHAWDAFLFDRFGEGNRAWERLKALVRIHALDQFLITINDWRGIYGGLNWFQNVKLIQMDAGMGVGAAISELFFSDFGEALRLFPALPGEVSEGRLTGLRSRDGVLVNLTWSKGVFQAELTSETTKVYHVVLPEGARDVTIAPTHAPLENGRSFEVELQKGACTHLAWRM